MDKTSDSDDSAFLFSMNLHKRKTRLNVRNEWNQLTLNYHGESKIKDEMLDQKINDADAKSPVAGNEVNLVEDEMLVSCNKNEQDLIAGKTFPKMKDCYSCALCLKIFQSETSYLTHMKICAKKFKMNTKQLLEALQLHKRHLKERISAGLSNMPQKKKKIHVQVENEDAENQLALGLALSKSLVTENDGKENQNITCRVSIQNTNKTTLEKFGFKSSGKIKTGTGKNAKNGRITYSVLKERTNEDREKLVTEKASVILLINNYAVTSETRESLRIYHCKRLEENRNKESYLWSLGEMVDVNEWYVNDLKDIILEESNKMKDKTPENVIQEQCNIDKEILKLDLPKNKIFDDWKKLINNKHLSDILLSTKDGQSIYLHSVVIYARYPKLLDFDMKTVFQNFNSQIILKFLQFLYCGTLNELLRREVENLLNLAQTIDYSELVENLENLKKFLSESEVHPENCNVSDRLEIDSTLECQEKKISPPGIDNWYESKCTNWSDLEGRIKYNHTMNGKNESVWNESEERNKNLIHEFCQESKEIKFEIENELTNKLSEEKLMNTKNNDSSTDSNTSNVNKSFHRIENLNIYEKRHQLDVDMFEELEPLNDTMKNIQNDSKPITEVDQECIEISSTSSKNSITDEVIMANSEENEKLLPEMDFEVPYFDPYEHFIDGIPDVEEQNILSQSLNVEEISPVKSSSSNRNRSFLNTESPEVSVPDYCSTPNIEISSLKTSMKTTLTTKEFSECAKKRKRYGTPCSKINKKSARFSIKSKAFSSKSRKKRKIDSDKIDTKKLADILTKSIMRELDDSISSSVGQTQTMKEKSYIEMTPAIPGEEFIENVSPLPDYSAMGASSIKKHLSKYGLKKSLSKNKAKKILRHIYEELHPIINMKNGKIVKYIRNDKLKKSKGKRIGGKIKKKRRENSIKKTLLSGKRERKSEACCSVLETPMRKKIDESLESVTETSAEPRNLDKDNSWKSPKVTPSKSPKTANDNDFLKSPQMTPSKSQRTVIEDDSQSWTSMDSDDGSSGSGGLPDGNYFEVEESLSQENYESAEDAYAAVYDFIENDKEIHRKILTYEPILLEQFQKQLFEKYNKKFRLTHLMDCLDGECITFYCESPKEKKSSQREKEVSLLTE